MTFCLYSMGASLCVNGHALIWEWGYKFFRSQFTAHGNCLWRKQMRVKWEKGKAKGKTATLDKEVKENVLCTLKAVDLHEIKSCLTQHCMTHPYDFALFTFSISFNEQNFDMQIVLAQEQQVQSYPIWTSSLSVYEVFVLFLFFVYLILPPSMKNCFASLKPK